METSNHTITDEDIDTAALTKRQSESVLIAAMDHLARDNEVYREVADELYRRGNLYDELDQFKEAMDRRYSATLKDGEARAHWDSAYCNYMDAVKGIKRARLSRC